MRYEIVCHEITGQKRERVVLIDTGDVEASLDEVVKVALRKASPAEVCLFDCLKVLR